MLIHGNVQYSYTLISYANNNFNLKRVFILYFNPSSTAMQSHNQNKIISRKHDAGNIYLEPAARTYKAE